jgi:hypothetical protein
MRLLSSILVTGGYGFIGSNFIRHLLKQPDFSGKIVNLDALTYAGNPENLEDIAQKYPSRYYFERGDIRDRKLVESIFRKHSIDTVMHLQQKAMWTDPFRTLKPSSVPMYWGPLRCSMLPVSFGRRNLGRNGNQKSFSSCKAPMKFTDRWAMMDISGKIRCTILIPPILPAKQQVTTLSWPIIIPMDCQRHFRTALTIMALINSRKTHTLMISICWKASASSLW